MNTRIRIKEYNNGNVEFICEKDLLEELRIHLWWFPLFWIVFPFLYFSDGKWKTIVMKRHYMDEKLKYGFFDTLEEAKEFIDSYIREQEEDRILEHGKEIKNETFVKYP